MIYVVKVSIPKLKKLVYSFFLSIHRLDTQVNFYQDPALTISELSLCTTAALLFFEFQ